MPLKPEVDLETFQTLDENTRAYYRQGDTDSVYVLDVEGVSDTGNLVSALEKIKEEKEKARREAMAAKKEQEALRKQLEEWEKKDAAQKVSNAEKTETFEQLYKRVETEKRELEEAHNNEKLKIQQKYRDLLLKNRVKDLSLQHGVIPAKLDQFMKVFHDRFDIEEDADKPIFKDANGDWFLKSTNEFFASLRKEADWAFVSNRAAGGLSENEGGSTSPRFGRNFELGPGKVLVINDEVSKQIKEGNFKITNAK